MESDSSYDYKNDDESSGDDYECSGDEGDYSKKRNQNQKSYTILTEADLRRRQDDEISRVTSVMSMSKESASLLLRNFNWSVSRVNENWFADEDRVRKKVGLFPKNSFFLGTKDATCRICFEHVSCKDMSSANCGHGFCNDCWKRYIEIAIEDGPVCLLLRCPSPKCNCAIDQNMIDRLVSDESKSKYSRFLFRSFVEQNPEIKWCPAPGCDYAIEFNDAGDGNYDISCLCSYSFCWNCTEESHRPVDCKTVSKWVIKNKSESENMTWILANSKQCPKCNCRIEKNQGCMHMTCPKPCNFEFCWLCLTSWTKHGNYYVCNVYEEQKRSGTFNEEELRRNMAKKASDRYMHYYERWQTNQTSRNKAIEDLQNAQTNHFPFWQTTFASTDMHLMFITEAWQQIIECRRVLKWTYAYGYYLPEDEPGKKEFFEHVQGLAESCLEKLHQCAENDASKFSADGNEPSCKFDEFRIKLCELTNAARTHFMNLVRALENGLSDVYTGTYRGLKVEDNEHAGGCDDSDDSDDSDDGDDGEVMLTNDDW